MNTIDLSSPIYAIDTNNLIPVSSYLQNMMEIPPSRMFLINKSLKVYQDKYPGEMIYDASQGDGGASLSGVTKEILERAASMQVEHGSAYDMPYGTDAYRKSVVEQYWKINQGLGIAPSNVVGTAGGRDALVKAYQAMLGLGHGRIGDVIIVSRVPWISYNWGPYGIGANVLYAPGYPDEGWAYSEDGILECVKFAEKTGRRVAGIVITTPDNPTGLTISPTRQVQLAKTALQAGIPFVLFDWMYHYVTDANPMDLNTFLPEFEQSERQRLIILDGITKSLGASNIRNCHLIASNDVTKFIISRASHSVMPSFYSLAVAMAAYEMGYETAAEPIITPTNASRLVIKKYLDEHQFKYILGKGYYAFIHVGEWIKMRGWNDTEPLGQYFAENFGIAIVPGAFFSRFGGEWVRFSYATPPEKTLGGLSRLIDGLDSLEAG